MPRPAFVPTPEQRKTVRSMAAMGMPQNEIAACIGLRSPKTLRRHFRNELDTAAIEANVRIARSLYEMATAGKNTAAAIFWLKTRGGGAWREHSSAGQRVIELPNFVVTPEKAA